MNQERRKAGKEVEFQSQKTRSDPSQNAAIEDQNSIPFLLSSFPDSYLFWLSGFQIHPLRQ
jgi:hypothetical protein